MNPHTPITDSAKTMRHVAEERLKMQQADDQQERSDDENIRLLHELQVHQIELEMQNEELIASRTEIEEMVTRYTDLYDFAPIGYVTLNRNSVIAQINLIGASLLNRTRAQLVNRRFSAFVSETDSAAFSTFLLRVFKTTVKQTCELNLVGQDQPPLVVQVEATLSADGQECRVALVDISARKQAEEALAAEKELLSVTLLSIGDGVITTDTNGNVRLLNKAAEDLTGWASAEAAGHPFAQVFDVVNQNTRQKCGNPVERILITDKVVDLENHTLLISKTNQEIAIAYSGAPIHNHENHIIGVVLVFRDMTEKQKLAESMQRTQKLESIGLLAGGIAHDFNNLLASILTNIELASRETTEAHVATLLVKALSNTDKARALTQQLLTFAKGGEPIKKVGYISTFVQETTQFALSGSSVLSIFQIQDNLWPCNVDQNQIGQVIDNLIINAQQAMPNGGTITVSANNISSVEEAHLPLEAGRYVKLSIKDEGVGIENALLPSIFDPYYTTKPEGNGLGLSTCYSIINRHGGCIDVESVLGKGSTFHVYLPASAEIPTPPVAEKSTKTHTGGGTILVMDDNRAYSEAMEMILESLGYTVVLTESGQDAIDFFMAETEANRELAGMIFDLTVPGAIGGKEAIHEIRKISSDVPAFVASGYGADPVMAHPEAYGFNASIHKPFDIAQLTEMLGLHL